MNINHIVNTTWWTVNMRVVFFMQSGTYEEKIGSYVALKKLDISWAPWRTSQAMVQQGKSMVHNVELKLYSCKVEVVHNVGLTNPNTQINGVPCPFIICFLLSCSEAPFNQSVEPIPLLLQICTSCTSKESLSQGTSYSVNNISVREANEHISRSVNNLGWFVWV